MILLFPALLFTSFVYAESGVCPENDAELLNWSDPSSWPNGKVPTANSVVQILRKVRLDISPPELQGIEINAGGRLVWGKTQGKGIHLRVHYIRVSAGGEMLIGSEDCSYGSNTTITLLGNREELSIPGFGEKFIGVEAGGVLELHGEKKLSWTKLTSTVPGFSAISPSFRHKDQTGIKRWNGVYLYHFKSDGTFVKRLFRGRRFIRTPVLMKFVTSVQDSDIIAMATQGDLDNTAMSKLYPVVDAVNAKNQVRMHRQDDAYVFAARKGGTFMDDIAKHKIRQEYSEAVVSLNIPGTAKTVVVMSRNNKERNSNSYIDFVVMKMSQSKPIIDVADDVSSWHVGDKIFITSTDYDWKQVEEFTIEKCAGCSSNQIQLNKPPRYTHYGEIYKRVDMRAEVGRMTRNIHITSEVAKGQTNGGHVKFLFGFKSVQVENVELTNLGDPLVTGRYPLHYHMCENLADKMIYTSLSYLRNNSIHHSQLRCITIHGTHNAQIQNNICFNTIGHGFFIEDGGEKHTFFEGNLGLGQKRWTGQTNHPVTGVLPSDRKPVTFWITNPLTKMKNNVAAGGDSVGVWFIFPQSPLGPSATKNFMRPGESKHTAIELFTNNVIHSYQQTGLFVDNQLFPNQTVNRVYNKLNPHMTPTDPTSERVPMVFDRTTIFKCRLRDLWIRGGPTIVRSASLAESMEVAALVKEETSYQLLEKSVILGLSGNVGEPQNVKAKNGSIIRWPRSMPMYRLSTTLRGFQFRRGPVFVRGSFFGGFQPTEEYNTAAFTHSSCVPEFNPRNNFMSTYFDFADGPNAGNRFLHVPCKREINSDANLAIRDFKGDFYIVKNIPFTTTNKCTFRKNWNAAKCPHIYGQVSVRTPATGNSMFVARTDTSFPTIEVTDRIPTQRFITILGGQFNYLFYFQNAVPKNVVLTASSVTKSMTVVLAYCIPRDANFRMKYKIGGTVLVSTQVSSLQEVQNDTEGGKHFFDQTVGVVFFKMLHDRNFIGELSECPQNRCPRVNIYIAKGDMSDSDCSSRFRGNPSYLQAATSSTLLGSEDKMPADLMSPPSWMGAGSTYPFPQ